MIPPGKHFVGNFNFYKRINCHLTSRLHGSACLWPFLVTKNKVCRSPGIMTFIVRIPKEVRKQEKSPQARFSKQLSCTHDSTAVPEVNSSSRSLHVCASVSLSSSLQLRASVCLLSGCVFPSELPFWSPSLFAYFKVTLPKSKDIASAIRSRLEYHSGRSYLPKPLGC